MTIRNSFFYKPYQTLNGGGASFADFSKQKNYYNQLAFLFEEGSSRNPYTKKEADFVVSLAKKYCNQSNLSFLDVPCGTGRHSRHISKKGFSVTGVDGSGKLLRVAKQRDKITFYKKGDLRNFKVGRKFDCAFSLWESYNYLSKTSEMKAFLDGCAQHLKKGGILILDSRNFWREGLLKKKVQERSFRTSMYDVDLIIRKQTFLKKRVHEGIFMYFATNRKNGRQSVVIDQELVRIYDIRDIKRLALRKFDIIGSFGDFDIKDNYSKRQSKRMIVVLRKN